MNCRSHKSVLVLCLLTALLSQRAWAASLVEGDRLYQRGEFTQAAAVYGDLIDDAGAAAVLGASRSLAMLGDYDSAIELCRQSLEAGKENPLVATQLAEVLFVTGRSDAALELLETVVNSSEAPIRALVKYGEMLQYRGDRDDARAYFSAAIADSISRADLNSEESALIARAHWLRGNYQRANALFREATRMDPRNMEAQVWWGDLFAEKFNEAEALRSYRTVLAFNPNYVPAVVGFARVSRSRGALERALFTNPRSTDAFIAFAELALEQNKFDEAKSYLNAALTNNAEALEVITPLAGIEKLRDNDVAYEEWRKKAETIRSSNGEFYTVIADMYATDYRFAEAVEFAGKAIEVQDDYWRAYTVLGANLARLGRVEKAREQLEFAFAKDPYNVRTANMLKVFDTLDSYVTRSSEHFQVTMSEADALVLWPYMAPLLEEAWNSMVEKYGFTPESPVLIEVFNKREDFAVRSVGLPDLGPLVGICFGKLITLISPDSLTANWQEIVWHEFVHVLTLQMTNNRIPRWLSEGISVYEEFQGREEWGRRQELELVRALDEGKIRPVERMDDAFLEATSDEDLGIAYLQSYLVVEYIVAEHGFDELRKLIQAFGRHESVEQILSRVFSQEIHEFNGKFSAWLEKRVAATDVYLHDEDSVDEGTGHGHGVRNNSSAMLAELYDNDSIKAHMRERIEQEPRDFQAHLQLGIVLYKEKDYRQAEKHLQAAKNILPRYSAYPSPSRVLTQIYRDLGRDEEYWEEMQYLLKYHQHDYRSALLLGRKLAKDGDYAAAKHYLERAIAVDPYQVAVHRELARLADRKGEFRVSIREYEIVVELDRSDPVDAHTHLAQAYLRGGQQQAAKRSSLLALEIAPTYKPAQKVLLEALEK